MSGGGGCGRYEHGETTAAVEASAAHCCRYTWSSLGAYKPGRTTFQEHRRHQVSLVRYLKIGHFNFKTTLFLNVGDQFQ